MRSKYIFLNKEGIAIKWIARFSIILGMATILIFETGCKKLVDVDPPATSITGSSVYNDDATAISAMTSIYAKMSSASFTFIQGISSISLMAALSADELTLYSGSSNTSYISYFKNSLSTNLGGYEYWNNLYTYIFICNSAIEGLSNSTSLSPSVRQQLLGEAKFMRAFFYFYLVNLYGDVPLAITTDWQLNSVLSRTPKDDVYRQIINDLKDSQGLLSALFVKGDAVSNTTERVRPNKWAATALLARAYLFNRDYVNAESEAGKIINNATLFSLTTLSNVFLKNSNEAIWQLQPVNGGQSTQDARLFIIPASGPSGSYPVYLNNNLLNNFEIGDQRRTNWIDSVTVLGTTYYYPYKYKVTSTPVAEYEMVLRLSEQYLIRAEAKAQQNKISEAQADLNAIRSRAGLNPTTANDKASLLTAIRHERQVELFTEWGHRWLDLKRTGNVDAIMNVVTPQKGSTWNSNWQWYPIPQYDLSKNSNLVQNVGY